MNNHYIVGIFGTIIAIILLTAANLAYKTFEIRESIKHMQITLAEINLESKEFLCDTQLFELLIQGLNEHEDTSNE